MSYMGQQCRVDCVERTKPLNARAWEVVRRNHTRSAFNGYRWAHSDYSDLKCRTCRSYWRTKAKYVSQIKDSKS